MKRILVLILTFAMIVATFSGCGKDKGDSSLLVPRKDDVINVTVSSLPEEYNYSFSEDDADAIVDYLSGLNLISDFQENPDAYNGMTWVITIEYENGDTVTVYHFGNMFIRTDSGSWYKMNYKEASRFDKLLDELNK